MVKKVIFGVLNALTLVLLFVSFTTEVLISFDRVFGLTLRRLFGLSRVVVGVVAAGIAVAMLLANCAIAYVRRSKVLVHWTMNLAIVVAVVWMLGVSRYSPYRTMSPEFDNELYVDEYGDISGEKLGLYAFGGSTNDAPVRFYWQCATVTSYGPIRYNGDVDEFFLAADSGEILAVRADEYADGTWITVKEFLSKDEKLKVFIGERDTEILAEYLETIPHEVVNLSGKTNAEIGQILEEATWGALTWKAEPAN